MDLIEYKSISVQFIYSFFLDFGSHDFKNDFIEHIQKFCKNYKKLDKNEYVFFPENCKIGPPSLRKGIEPSFRNKVIKEAYFNYANLLGNVEGNEVEISRLARIFDSGLGTFSIDIFYKGNNSTKLFTKHIQNTHQLINELYTKEDDNILYKIKTLKKDGDIIFNSITIFELFTKAIQKLLELFNPKKKKDNKIILLDEIVADTEKGEYQHPFVVTICTLSKDKYDEIFLDNDCLENLYQRRNKYKKEILSILLRDILPENVSFIDQGFADEYIRTIKGFPINMNLNSKFFMTFHPRSCLVFKTNQDSDPSKFIQPSLLSVIELLRMRWHSTIIINGILDLLIKEMRNLNDAISLNILTKIIQYRAKLARMLEDPMNYSWGGGSLNVLYDKASKDIWLDKLEKISIEKLNILDRLYNDSLQRVEIIRFEDFIKSKA